jgi:hypothetical protein
MIGGHPDDPRFFQQGEDLARSANNPLNQANGIEMDTT